MLPKCASAVIIGGGVIGASTAYHLIQHSNYKDVILLEQGSLTCGTTWHAAGLIGQMRSTSAEIELSRYGCHLLQKLEDDGYPTGWEKCGSLSLSTCKERMVHLKRNLSRARSFNIEAELISPNEALSKWPYFDKENVNGALWLPNDGSAVSTDLTMALINAAKDKGLRVFEDTQVTNISTKTTNGLQKVTGVSTNRGDVQSDVIVLCAGLWSPHLKKELTLPLHPCYHMYVVTEACGILKDLPILRDLDGLIYAREWSGGLCVGGFELNAKPCFVNEKPGKLEYHLFPEDYEQFDSILQNAMKRIPFMRNSGIRQFINGPESFTIDNAYILGEAPDIKRLYIACGFNSSGIASSGGAGLALSEMIMNEGKGTRDLWTLDTRRFAPFQKSSQFLQQRVSETLGFHYSIPWPLREFSTGRGIRRSPLYNMLKEKKALFGNKFGWERANVFMKTGPLDFKAMIESWTVNEQLNELIRQEHLHTREKVSVFDQSSFSKYYIQGKDALSAVEYLFCAKMDVPVNKMVYSGMLNEQGGYEADMTIIRVEEQGFFLISATATTTRDLLWIKEIIRTKDFNATVTDVTSTYSILSVMGPYSRLLLEKLVEDKAEICNKELPFTWSKEIGIGMARARASRISYMGTLGFELMIPSEMTQYIYELLHENGAEYELQDAGYYAIDSLRVEKGNRAWGLELRCDVNPLEAGLGFTVDWQKRDFIGKSALLKSKNLGLKKKIVSFTVEGDSKLLLLGDEPIYRDNELVGYVTSCKYGYSLNKWVCLARLAVSNGNIDKEWLGKGAYEIEVLQERVKANLCLRAPYDPDNAQILK